MKKEPEEYYPTKVRPLVQMVARMVQKNPALADNPDVLWAHVQASAEEFRDPSKCEGCARSMKVSIYEADLLDALLILKMARKVREQMQKGVSFTEANKVHIPTLGASQGILKRQTKCDYLGLIKQNENWRYTGYWCLTTWAWKALRGAEIPKAVKYWEGHILGRSRAQTTLKQMFDTHRSQIEQAVNKRKSVKADYRAVYEDYDPNEWGGYGQDLSTLDDGIGTLSTAYKD